MTLPGPEMLERYVLGEADAQEREAVEAAAAADASLERWLSERQAEARAFAVDPNKKPFSALVDEAQGEKRKRRAWPMMIATPLIGGLAGLFLFVVSAPPEPSGGIRVKGGVSVQAAVQRADAAPQIYEPGAALYPKDRVRLTVDDPQGGFVTVLLEERSGEVSVLYAPDELGPVGPGRHELPGSLELDGALGRERVYVLVSDARPDVELWLTEISKARSQRGFAHGWLPAGDVRFSVWEYEKVAP